MLWPSVVDRHGRAVPVVIGGLVRINQLADVGLSNCSWRSCCSASAWR
ncbi:MAG: hypothetical protein ACLR0N_05865 [Bilophila wadsworthia]